MASQLRKSQRQEKILAALHLNPSLRVHQLSEALGVSAETVRRDLAELDDSGKIKRTYGGAVRAQEFEPALSERLMLHVGERQAIAERTVGLLRGVEAMLIGGGSTTLHFAKALSATEQALTVITPAYNVAVELSRNPRIEVICLPGNFDGHEGLVHGPSTISAVAGFHLPVAVIGVSGLHRGGISEAMPGAAEVYRAIISNADRVFIVADSSKFNKRALTLLSDWQDNFTLVTDAEPDGELRAALQDRGARIEIAEPSRKPAGTPVQARPSSISY